MIEVRLPASVCSVWRTTALVLALFLPVCPGDAAGGDLPGSAAGLSTLDIVAERVFLRTAPGTGTEVSDPTIGQLLFSHVEYRVEESVGPLTVEVRGMVDGVPLCEGPVDLQPGGRLQLWCQNAWLVTAGSHILSWELDVLDSIGEADESNNTATVSFSVDFPLLDVEALRAFLRTAAGSGVEVQRPARGEEVFFHLDYRISGPLPPSRLSLRAFLDDVMHCDGAIDVQGSGALQVWCSNAWVATDGAHTLRWELDPTEDIDEADEDNNTAELLFVVGEPAGDANCDGDLNAADLVRVVVLLVNNARAPCGLDDADQNGTLDDADLDATIARIFGNVF